MTQSSDVPYTISGIYTIEEAGNYKFWFWDQIYEEESSKFLAFTDYFAVNLTQIFGSGNELTKKEAKTLIRDYNGLRAKINEVNERINKVEEKVNTQSDNRKEYIGYIIAAISTLFLLLNYFK